MLYWILLGSFIALAAVVAPLLLVVTAPYGRYARPGWGPSIPARLGWFLMELPALVVFAGCFMAGRQRSPTAIAFLSLWVTHYGYRTFAFPLLIRPGGGRMPVAVIMSGMAFNMINGYLNGRWLFTLGRYDDWLRDPRFMVGVAMFALGFAGHVSADRRLRALRAPGQSGYSIPHGGLFQWVSCPNYLGEIVEWAGWALATWSLPGLAFAVWTAANLAPRARAHHRWYQANFPLYPPTRRALVPGVW